VNDPTDEQLDIIQAASLTTDNLMLNAHAGCGKTTTLELVQASIKTSKPILYLVFAKKNAEEAIEKMPSTTAVKTFNGCGHGIWASTISKNLRLNAKKTQDILAALIKETPSRAQGQLWDSFSEVVAGVNMAKAVGYVPENKFNNAKRLLKQNEFHRALEEVPDDLTSDLIDAVLSRSILQAYDGIIDFNDQIYMPSLFGGIFPIYDNILVDEYQDLNPVNHVMIERLAKRRIFGVGDPYQNIYGFRGAKAGGMADAVEKYSMKSFPLSISFRCPEAIVDHVRWRVPHFKALKPGGEVHAPEFLDADSIPDSCTIICRNNAPLFRMAFRLLGIGRSVSVAGSDIGPRLIKTMQKLGPEELTRTQSLQAISDWLEERLAREAKNAIDMAECMKVFVNQSSSLGTAIAYATHLFQQTGSIRLLTGHKSKGLEFDDVIHLDPQLLSSTEQDKNLSYVISTRSKNRLTEIQSDSIRW
jgi:superfamily I DNA/RNA helicase